MVAFYDALAGIVAQQRPMTVRQAFYAATVAGLIDKDEREYERVQRALLAMRRTGKLGYNDIVDVTRWMRRGDCYTGLADFIDTHQRAYRRNLLADAGVHVEVWLEKDALAGVVYDVSDHYTCPLMVSRGFASESYLYTSALTLQSLNRPAFIYYAGDWDPAGVLIPLKIEAKLRELAPDVDLTFERIAIVEADTEALPSRPAKSTDSRAKGWAGPCVELDALPADELRRRVASAIERHLDPRRVAYLRDVEAAEREDLTRMFGGLQ